MAAQTNRSRTRVPIGDRLKRNLKVVDSGCWLWTGSTTINGYGTIEIRCQKRLAHRVAFETWIGPIPEEMVLDHLCAIKACINPLHLQPVWAEENSRRTSWKGKCPQGHRLPTGGPQHMDTPFCLVCEQIGAPTHH